MFRLHTAFLGLDHLYYYLEESGNSIRGKTDQCCYVLRKYVRKEYINTIGQILARELEEAFIWCTLFNLSTVDEWVRAIINNTWRRAVIPLEKARRKLRNAVMSCTSISTRNT